MHCNLLIASGTSTILSFLCQQLLNCQERSAPLSPAHLPASGSLIPKASDRAVSRSCPREETLLEIVGHGGQADIRLPQEADGDPRPGHVDRVVACLLDQLCADGVVGAKTIRGPSSNFRSCVVARTVHSYLPQDAIGPV